MATKYYYTWDGKYLGTSPPSWRTAQHYKTSYDAPVNGRMPEKKAASGGSGYQASGAPELYQQRYGEASFLLDTLSDQQRQDLMNRYSNLGANTQSQLISSGLQATTILPSLQRGIERERSADLNLLNDQLARERLGVLSDFTAGEASARTSEAASRNSYNLNRAQLRLSEQQMAQQASLEAQRLAQYGSRYRSSSSTANRSQRGTISSRYGNTYSYPGSVASYQQRYA